VLAKLLRDESRTPPAAEPADSRGDSPLDLPRVRSLRYLQRRGEHGIGSFRADAEMMDGGSHRRASCQPRGTPGHRAGPAPGRPALPPVKGHLPAGRLSTDCSFPGPAVTHVAAGAQAFSRTKASRPPR